MSDSILVTISGEMTIGQVFTNFPHTKSVIEKYFHGGCHHCPSQHTEPLWLAAKLYAVPLEQLLFELREAAGVDKDSVTLATQSETALPLSPTERRLARDRARGLQY